MSTLFGDEFGQRATLPQFVFDTDDFDEAHPLGLAMREHRTFGAVPFSAGRGTPFGIRQQPRLSSPRAAITRCQPSGIVMNIIDESQLSRKSTERGDSCGYIRTPWAPSSFATSTQCCVISGASSDETNPVQVIGIPRLPQRVPRSRSVSSAVPPSRFGTTSSSPRPAACTTSSNASNSGPSAAREGTGRPC